MKVICAPDSYKESISAVDAASAMAEGVRRVAPDALVDVCPVGDGGEGTLGALLEAIDGRLVAARVHGIFGEMIDASFGVFGDGSFCFVESAAAIGLAAIPAAERDVMSASSYGVGELMLEAAASSPQRIIVGVGGSATNDGGCGMAQAIGVRFFDASDRLIGQPVAGGTLRNIARIDMTGRSKRLDGIGLCVACDVNNPLTGPDGAAIVYGPQKGATLAQAGELDDGLSHLAEVIRRDLGLRIEATPGAGAAGGLGGGLLAFAGAKLDSGIETVLDATGFADRIAGADLCLTGEGRLDAQSLAGKACLGVARAATRSGVATIALVGAAGPGADECVAAGLSDYVVIGEALPADQSMRQARSLLADAAAAVIKKHLLNGVTIEGSPRGSEQ